MKRYLGLLSVWRRGRKSTAAVRSIHWVFEHLASVCRENEKKLCMRGPNRENHTMAFAEGNRRALVTETSMTCPCRARTIEDFRCANEPAWEHVRETHERDETNDEFLLEGAHKHTHNTIHYTRIDTVTFHTILGWRKTKLSRVLLFLLMWKA